MFINQGGNLCLDFTDIDLITGAFFNPLVSKLIKNFGEERANQVFNDIQSLSDIDRELLNKTIERAKKIVRCCGSCKWFVDEFIEGSGWCCSDETVHHCSEICDEWRDRNEPTIPPEPMTKERFIEILKAGNNDK